MKSYGLKLWSTNDFYVTEAYNLFQKGVYDYIELYAIPDSFDTFAHLWAELDIPYIIHGPHFMHGLNFSVKEKEKENIRLVEHTFKYADLLKAEKIIFHPGIKGSYKETARQIKNINDKRIILENKPYNVTVKTKELSLDDVCVGHNIEQIKYIIETANIGFCLDIGHGICASNSLNIDYEIFLKEFISLNPYMYHLSDGDINGVRDKHYNIGNGTYDFNKIYSLLPTNAKISIETEKASKENLNDFIEDVKKLKMYS